MATWVKQNGEWLAKVEGGDFPVHMIGMPLTVVAKSGRKTRVVITDHVKGWLGRGGIHVDLYRVTTTGGKDNGNS